MDDVNKELPDNDAVKRFLRDVELELGVRLLAPLEARLKKLETQFADQLKHAGHRPAPDEYFGYPLGPKLREKLWPGTPTDRSDEDRPAWALRLDVLLGEWIITKIDTPVLLQRLKQYEEELQATANVVDADAINAVRRLKAVFSDPRELEMLKVYRGYHDGLEMPIGP